MDNWIAVNSPFLIACGVLLVVFACLVYMTTYALMGFVDLWRALRKPDPDANTQPYKTDDREPRG